jgi:hypothetical protein
VIDEYRSEILPDLVEQLLLSLVRPTEVEEV